MIKLFCVPFAGGASTEYMKWKDDISENVVIYPIELAGHGTRISDKLYDSVDEAATDVAEFIKDNLEEDDVYAIYGHSMGSLIAFETYYKLVESGIHAPCHMFFSGRQAPQNVGEKTEYYLLPDDEFLKVVYMYGGTTKLVMDNVELKELFVPILKADFKILETYTHEERSLMTCDVTVINGSYDQSILRFDMSEWKKYAGREFDMHIVYGDHFFLFQNSSYLCNIINESLKEFC